jgi:hypothetical protein
MAGELHLTLSVFGFTLGNTGVVQAHLDTPLVLEAKELCTSAEEEEQGKSAAALRAERLGRRASDRSRVAMTHPKEPMLSSGIAPPSVAAIASLFARALQRAALLVRSVASFKVSCSHFSGLAGQRKVSRGRLIDPFLGTSQAFSLHRCRGNMLRGLFADDLALVQVGSAWKL